MPITPPIPPEQASPEIQAIYNRIKETLGGGQVVPTGYQMMAHVEAFLQDSYMNYRKFVHDGAGKLDAVQREAVALATSSAMNCGSCVRSHAKLAVKAGLTELQVAEVLAVAATCAMYNIYYKFRSLAGDPMFEGYSVGLRAHTFQKNSLGPQTTELINIVVSNINGCPKCTAGHVKRALELGLSHEQIDEAVKISATKAAFNTFHRTQ